MHLIFYKRLALRIIFPSLFIFQGITGQLPPRDYFNFSFENNFNDNATGHYTSSDFHKDWNTFGNSRQSTMDILSESDSRHLRYMRGYFPKGTFGPYKGGWSWNSPISGKPAEIYFSYDIRFKPGFQWVSGGKIPGITGGATRSSSKPLYSDGFSVRVNWKGGGQPDLYVYHQDQPSIYGSSYTIENFHFFTGKWYNITLRVVLNSVSNNVGANNGILEAYIDGKLMFQKTNFRFRNYESIGIDNLYVCSFFGGSTTEYNSARDEWIDTDNFVAYSYSSKATNVPKGRVAGSKSNNLLHPYLTMSGSTPPPKSTPATGILAAPVSLATTGQTSTTVSLNWTDKSTGEEGFRLYRSTSQSTGFVAVATVSPNATTYINSALRPSTTYYYRVRGFKGNIFSPYSNVLAVKTKPSSQTKSTVQQEDTVTINAEDLPLKNSEYLIEVFPNPVTSLATLAITPPYDETPASETVIRIVDFSGKEFFHESLGNPVDKIERIVDFSEFSRGIYFLQVIVSGNALKTEKIIVK